MRLVFGLLVALFADGLEANDETVAADCYMNDINIPGYDIEIVRSVASADDCHAKCVEKDGCVYFTFVNETHPDRDTRKGYCFLKGKDTVTNPDFISGDADCTGDDCYKLDVLIKTGNSHFWIESGGLNIIKIPNVANAAECQYHCVKTKFCKRFSLYTKDIRTVDGQVGWPGDCILVAGENIPWTGLVSGDKSCDEEKCLNRDMCSVALHGGELDRPDESRRVRSTATAFDCKDKCNSTTGCERFTFVESTTYRYSAEVIKGYCYVKTSPTDYVEEIGIISGPAVCPDDAGPDGCFLTDVEFFTHRGKNNWFRQLNRKVNMVYGVPDKETCHQHCKDTDLCKQFIFAANLTKTEKPFHRTGDCLLVADLFTPFPGVVSGPKNC